MLISALLLAGCPDAGKDSKGKKGKAAASASAKATGAGKTTKVKSKGDAGEVGAAGSKRQQIAVGQWHKHRVKSKKGDATVLYHITGKEGSAHWLHFEYSGPNKMSVDILVDFADLKSFRVTNIKKAKVTLPGGRQHVVEGAMLNRMKDKLADALGAFGSSPFADPSTPREDVTVPAGTFKKCVTHSGKFQAFNITSESTAWNHTSVPLTALVKLETKDGSVWELMSHGTDGKPK